MRRTGRICFGIWAAAALALVAGAAQDVPRSGVPAERPADAPTATFGVTVVDTTGLEGKIYLLKRGARRLPNFKKMKSQGSIYTATLNVPPRHFTDGFPGVTHRFEWFAIDYAGRFWIEQPGAYRFSLLSDDGSKLYIDDRLVIDNDGIHWAMARAGSAELSAGVHRIRVSYFQGPRDEVALVLSVARPGERMRIFSTREFRPANPDDWKDPGAGAAGRGK
jgi:PA14 domain